MDVQTKAKPASSTVEQTSLQSFYLWIELISVSLDSVALL